MVPIAPLAEQRRIVARIDELFTEIADGEAALTRARNDLDTWRRALLKAAVTGELTREWREHNEPNETGAGLVLAFAAPSNARFGINATRLARFRADRRSNSSRIARTWAWAQLKKRVEVQLGGSVHRSTITANTCVPILRVANVAGGRSRSFDVNGYEFSLPEES